MQEFLASYAVQVDEDGARRLQAILDRNRETAAGLAEAFEAAHTALTALKRELSSSAGLKDVLAGLAGRFGSLLPPGGIPPAGEGKLPLGGTSAPASPGLAKLAVSADFTEAGEALGAFKTRMESERPKLSVNTSGITAAVSSAIATIRSMMSSVHITVPVTAKARLDTSGLGSPSPVAVPSGPVLALGSGGRVDAPTLAVVAESGRPEYVIPTDDESRAVPLLRSLIAELSGSARNALFSGGISLSGGGSVSHSVQAPVNIHVTAPAASPEAVARGVYDAAQRSLLKTLKGVFA